MAGTSTNDFQSGNPFYLNPNQQDLLLAALASNNQVNSGMFSSDVNNQQSVNGSQFPFSTDNIDPNYFTSPQQTTPSGGFNNGSVEESPFADYLDGDASFDFDNADCDLMIGALPGDSPEQRGEESTEKRKSPDDDADEPDGGGKRRETEDKQAKKPGRKPLTSEPTTKRKAQNRAAQRAFRERKEKHLKDLETKVDELEKSSDAATHENGLLRAQVQRLQVELREYRKRLSLNSTSLNRSPPLAGGFSSLLGNNGSTTNNFQFEFPRFGGLPGSHILDNGTLAKATNKPVSIPPASAPARQDSTVRSLSPASPANDPAANSPDKNGASPSTIGLPRSGSLNSLFTPPDSTSVSTAAKPSRSSTTDVSTDPSRVFQFNGGSSTHSNSPSASSNSQGGLNSSCDTSPEPSHNSPNSIGDTIADGYVCHGNSEGEITFCEKLNMACGNPRNPIPRAMSQSDANPTPAAPTKTPVADVNGLDFFVSQNGGQFNPELFGDYRDTQNDIVGDGDFAGGFFNDAFPIADFGSPFHFGDTPAVQKSNPLEEIERLQEADDEVVPGDDMTQMLNCHKIWLVILLMVHLFFGKYH
ncbi:transcription factor PAP1-domain-containing protein [Massariosphaeria phaeospora]|uniref:Transcription factor PAP1-domain-containing protein n=1 Tax=Massariosphaeria phaeospora TaxID=100035 RepID=A0A7C8IDF4_9PLEO|nr:transcription factor PAP1-domain-containing protein [Massariosphaeria phaeospora]